MPTTEILPITELSEAFLANAAGEMAQFSVGFLAIEDTPRGQDARLLGSGTLVSAGQVHAILTAHHVIKNLPKEGRLGLILAPTLHQHTVDTKALVYKKIARGAIDSDGPDLGAVILAPSVAVTIAAKKVFYNLDSRRDQMLSDPPDRQEGVWFVHGFVDEGTREEPGRDGYSLVKSFYSFSGAGGPDKPAMQAGDHDYYAFPVTHNARSVAPINFGGMSGGGLWQVPLLRDESGEVRAKRWLLSGLVFYQVPTTDTECGVKCHGRSSIYKVAYDAIARSEP